MRSILLTALLICTPLAYADNSSDQRGAVQANFDDFQANFNSLVFSVNGHIEALENDANDAYEGHLMCSDGAQLVNLFQNNSRFAAEFDKAYAPDLTFAGSLKTWREITANTQSECNTFKKAYDKMDLNL